MTPFRIPANILLTGEYAVLEPGGVGIAVAVEPSVRVTVEDAKRFSVRGLAGRRELEWSPDAGGDRFLEAIVRVVASELTGQSYTPQRGDTTAPGAGNPNGSAAHHDTSAAVSELSSLPSVRITVDSSAFFDDAGTKLGYGSSAAVAAAVVRALARLLKVSDRDLAAVAVRAHRAAQGGRGSGYDVAASLSGGVGRFVGGAEPSWTPLSPPARADRVGLAQIALFHGPKSVDTRAAIAELSAFRARDPRRFSAFLRHSNLASESAARAISREEWNGFRAALAEGARNAGELGRLIGVPAAVPAALSRWAEERGGIAKCVGAGDELVAVVLPPDAAIESGRLASPPGGRWTPMAPPEEDR